MISAGKISAYEITVVSVDIDSTTPKRVRAAGQLRRQHEEDRRDHAGQQVDVDRRAEPGREAAEEQRAAAVDAADRERAVGAHDPRRAAGHDRPHEHAAHQVGEELRERRVVDDDVRGAVGRRLVVDRAAPGGQRGPDRVDEAGRAGQGLGRQHQQDADRSGCRTARATRRPSAARRTARPSARPSSRRPPSSAARSRRG